MLRVERGRYRGCLSMPLSAAARPFSNLKINVSCEALLPGRRPAMRLLVRIVRKTLRGPEAEPRVAGAISEPILVTTNRAKGRGDGVNTRDPVSRLPGIGTETARKLASFDEWKAQMSNPAASGVNDAIAKTGRIVTVRAAAAAACPCSDAAAGPLLVRHWGAVGPAANHFARRCLHFAVRRA